ncbi:hypothetical protein [Pseudomonas sp. PMCC200344]|uniref:hypothetical protein n=1 Tax=Pseudomonas sp. PMCC200344 TaxID=3042028 RepID=UPI0024B370C4|nr:hypothetical protein [Pseudomonas sp. PMCC200344]
MTEEDLLTQCEEGHCKAYVRLTGGRGLTQVSGEPGDEPESVFVAGIQRVLNPQNIRLARSGAPVSLRLFGPVFREADDSFDEVTRVWDAVVDLKNGDLAFKPADVAALADTINGVIPEAYDLDAKEEASASAIIAVLAYMSGLDVTKPYAAYETMKTAAPLARVAIPSPGTIKKFFDLAADRIVPAPTK